MKERYLKLLDVLFKKNLLGNIDLPEELVALNRTLLDSKKLAFRSTNEVELMTYLKDIKKGSLEEKLFEIVEASKNNAEVSVAAANAMTVLNASRVIFSIREGLSLRRVNIPGADLTGAQLGGLDLSEAHLENVNFTNANLSGVKLNGAFVKGMILEELNIKKNRPIGSNNMVVSADGNVFAREANLNTIEIWDLSKNGNRNPHVVRGHKKRLNSLSLSGDGKILAGGGENNMIHIWDLSKNSHCGFGRVMIIVLIK